MVLGDLDAMKFKILYADAAQCTDGVTHEQLLRHMPVGNDVTIVMVVTHPNYKFNHDLNSLRGKKYVLMDFCEWGWQWDFTKNNILGQTDAYPGESKSHEWGTLHQFIRDNPPILTFQRELRSQNATTSLIPIDFLCTQPAKPIVGKAEYDARPIQVFASWGFSHPRRARVHGEILTAMGTKNIEVVDGYEKVDWGWLRKDGRVWLSVFTPHWMRYPMSTVYGWQSKSKISLSMQGAGGKAFRDQQAPVDCVMAHHAHFLAKAYPFDESNSICLVEPNEIDDLLKAVERNDLYELYLESQKTIDKYRVENYLPNYIIASIKRFV